MTASAGPPDLSARDVASRDRRWLPPNLALRDATEPGAAAGSAAAGRKSASDPAAAGLATQRCAEISNSTPVALLQSPDGLDNWFASRLKTPSLLIFNPLLIWGSPAIQP